MHIIKSKKYLRLALILLASAALALVVFIPVSFRNLQTTTIGTNISTAGTLAAGNTTITGTLTTSGNATFSANLSGKTLINPKQSAQSMAATDAVTLSGSFVVIQPSGAAAVTLTSAPTIADGTAAGQHLWVAGGSTTAVILQSGELLTNSNLKLGTSTRVIRQDTILHLIFDGTDWQEVSYDENGIGELLFSDDFSGDEFDNVWVLGSVAGVPSAPISNDANNTGTVVITTGTAANNDAFLDFNNLFWTNFVEKPVMRMRFRLSHSSNIGPYMAIKTGPSGPIVGIAFDATASWQFGGTPPNTSNFWCFATNSGATPPNNSSFIDTGVALDTNYHEMEIRVISSTQADCYFDNKFIGSLTPPNSTTLSSGTTLFFYVANRSGDSVARSLYLDYIKLYAARQQ